jgi:hypothetical protein
VLTGSFLRNIHFENNTCVNAGGGWAAGQRPDKKGFHLYFSAITATTDSIFIRNNIFYKSRAVLFVDNTSVQTLEHTLLDYNDWYTPNSTDTIVALWTSSSLQVYNAAQFAQYQSNRNEDIHSIISDPLLVNPTGNDFHLTAFSPCIRAGLNTGLGSDFSNWARPASGPYDIGAYQYATTGVENTDNDNSKIQIYPNPGTGTFTLTGTTASTYIEIFDPTGKKVFSDTIHNNQPYILYLQNFAPGIYLCNGSINGLNVFNKKIVVEK